MVIENIETCGKKLWEFFYDINWHKPYSMRVLNKKGRLITSDYTSLPGNILSMDDFVVSSCTVRKFDSPFKKDVFTVRLSCEYTHDDLLIECVERAWGVLD